MLNKDETVMFESDEEADVVDETTGPAEASRRKTKDRKRKSLDDTTNTEKKARD